MARKAFYSFHYDADNWRAATVRQIGAIEGNQTVTDNEWEEVTSGGEPAIKAWIESQMRGKSCVIVLIGSETAGRKWINYEIATGWNNSKGVVGIYIHNLLDRQQHQAKKGQNPFTPVTLGSTPLSSIVRAYDPPYTASKDVYGYIEENIEGWVDEAVAIRGRYR